MLGCLIFHGDIMTFLSSTSMTCITFVGTLTALTTALTLLLFLSIDRVTRHLVRVRLVVPCQPVLLYPFEIISGAIWFDRMWNKLWGGSVTESLRS